MQLPPGNGTFRMKNAVQFVSLLLSHLVQDAKYLEMTVYPFKDSACITFTFTAS